MAYTFYKSEKHPDRQIMYIAYMMIGSFFKKSIPASKTLEQQLFLHYQEMKADKQEKAEKKMLQDATRILSCQLAVLEKMQAQVSFQVGDETSCITFETGFECIYVQVDRNGSYEIFFCEP